jgi:hypothetical protein
MFSLRLFNDAFSNSAYGPIALNGGTKQLINTAGRVWRKAIKKGKAISVTSRRGP